MPTKKQHNEMMAAEFRSGVKASDFYGDEHLSPQEATERRLKSEQSMHRIRESEKGEVLGYYSWDKENDRLKFTVNNDLK